ncbi:DUF523 domain-containing protein [candidate division WOR-3 bacterium]|uniref:DUF523 domain-containing protein n=1 Tax=candidate division WOR-3 bacterium TaxID=2052148 RepID=A0A937XH53_UNCW3|nr:DUF523 domain-containing protein [candidate division WOR-3 bacterium]
MKLEAPGRRPVVVVSRCLLGERCRYDGKTVSSPAVRRLGEMVSFVPVCPEMEIGLGVPRDPIRLVRTSGGVRLVQARTGRDLTAKLRAFGQRFLAGLDVDAFLLKSHSPSCAVRDATVCDPRGRVLSVRLAGRFAAAARRRFPSVLLWDEQMLAEPGAGRQFGQEIRLRAAK